MNQSEKDLLLEIVRRDIAEKSAEIASCREQLKSAEQELTELRHIESYLINGPTNLTTPRSVELISVMEIAKGAERILRGTGRDKPLRVMDIAKGLASDYNPKNDTRKFECRVYSILKRRRDVFANAGQRGFWTLVEFNQPDGGKVTSGQSLEAPS